MVCEHFSNFQERMEKEGKEIRYPKSMESYQEEESNQDDEYDQD